MADFTTLPPELMDLGDAAGTAAFDVMQGGGSFDECMTAGMDVMTEGGMPPEVMANMADGGVTPISDAKSLSDLGFAFAIFPGTAALAGAAAVEKVLNRLKSTGTSVHHDIELFDFSEFCQLIGFDDIGDFEERWLNPIEKEKPS